MKQGLSIALLLGSVALACSGTKGSFFDVALGAQHLRLEVACSSNADCPAKFECESETEQGVASTFCSSVEEISSTGSGGAMCPAGYEVEKEHGISFCRPQGGSQAGEDHGTGGSDDGAAHGASDDGAAHEASDDGASHEAGDDRGTGGSDDGAAHEAGDDHGAGGSGDDDTTDDACDDTGTGGSDDGAAHDAGDDHGSSGDHGADDSGHGKGGK